MLRCVVTSSTMRSIGYDRSARVLEIEFEGGAIYQYLDVPLEAYQALMAAQSHGTYFNHYMRDRYIYLQL